ncbi:MULTISPECIES: DUF6612 family protein [unclassified Sporosarcina]|uniref:DUF6612 family protein n=1 Tax=unclassified Sporosarcina TaxID=2647733 RepID=UPI00203EE022|nr:MULTISPECIES: DUF6612 family protein [unclassified Sporosarcina]GKV67391.1 hypothetical protein NCCP2331_35440 [Sporosarcina sp. NCCP-2331]GLB57747.1 hypothetical protein NCCP2378_35370 [Sporosarcina sp. NCCP-2378]
MKKYSKGLLLLLSVVLLAACSESADQLTMDEVENRMDQSVEEMDNYEIDLALKVLAKDMEKGEQKQVNRGKIQYIDKESPEFHASYVTTTDGQSNDFTSEVYRKDNIVLTNENGGDWQDVSGKYSEEELMNAQYDKLVASLREVSDELAMKEKDKEYILTYAGNDQELYKVFQKQFNISFSGVDSSNIHSTLEAKITKDHMRLKEFQYEAEGKNPMQSVTITVNLEYGKVGEVEEIVLPNYQ